MSNMSICRICLIHDVRMCDIYNTPLQDIYEKLSDALLESGDGRPLIVCYICYSHLKMCLKLRDNCIMANSLLTQLLLTELGLTQESLTVIDRQAYNLVNGLTFSPPEYISVEDIVVNGEINTKETKKSKLLTKKGAVKKKPKAAAEPQKELSNDFGPLSDFDNDKLSLSNSDDDEDEPLKSVREKKNSEKHISSLFKVRNREKPFVKGFKADYAREIILSKEEQIQELKERAKSLNYLNSPYKCDMCYKGFVDLRAYENHKERHDEKAGSHCCAICQMRYRTLRQLRTHAATAHERHYACNKCEHRAHTANQAREHDKWHSGHTYECKLCGQKFGKPTSYLTHMRKRHPTENVCNMCGDTFVGRRGLLMHKSKTHKGDDRPIENPQEPASERFCGECNIQFVTMEAWKRHMLTSINHVLGNDNSTSCRICGAQYEAGGAGAHYREHSRALRMARAVHPVRGRAIAELSCDVCGAHFVNRSKLQAHIKRIHLGVKYNKNIVCEVCGKKCTSNASLKYHQRTHTGEKPYPCATCAKRFSDNNQLRIHVRTHTGERPYCCAACGKRFSQKPALNRHYRVHTGAKPYECQYCSKTFTQSNSLKLHVRTVHLKLPPNNRKSRAKVVENTTNNVQMFNTIQQIDNCNGEVS